MIRKSTKPVVQPWQPTPEQEAKLRASDVSLTWLYNMPREEWLRYSGQWIAIEDCRVISSGISFDELLTKLGDTDLGTVIIHKIERPGRAIYR